MSVLDPNLVLVLFASAMLLLEVQMPAWSPEIANEFIRLGSVDGRAFDQLQLQALVYIAHGWRLASSGEPLTGDRPEARSFGPVYRRLADALAPYGEDPVYDEIWSGGRSIEDRSGIRFPSELDQSETELLEEIYQTHGCFESWQLATVTSSDAAPWNAIFAGGGGEYGDIPHRLIRAQFVDLLDQTKASEAQ